MIAKEEILARFSKVYKSGEGEYQCLCPSHDDSTASLGLKFVEDKMILNCFAGCNMEAILGAAGLSWSDVMPNSIDNEWKPKTKIKFNPYSIIKACRDDFLFVAMCAASIRMSEKLATPDLDKLFDLTRKYREIYDNIK